MDHTNPQKIFSTLQSKLIYSILNDPRIKLCCPDIPHDHNDRVLLTADLVAACYPVLELKNFLDEKSKLIKTKEQAILKEVQDDFIQICRIPYLYELMTNSKRVIHYSYLSNEHKPIFINLLQTIPEGEREELIELLHENFEVPLDILQHKKEKTTPKTPSKTTRKLDQEKRIKQSENEVKTPSISTSQQKSSPKTMSGLDIENRHKSEKAIRDYSKQAPEKILNNLGVYSTRVKKPAPVAHHAEIRKITPPESYVASVIEEPKVPALLEHSMKNVSTALGKLLNTANTRGQVSSLF